MEKEISKLRPERIWHYFLEICKIPRASKKEKEIAEYIIKFGKKHNLETFQDGTGNVLIRKPGTKGKENIKSVCLQSHIDMVCEKNNDVIHNFDKDPINAYIDNGWVKAKGTTLGADDGIGVATELAILEATNIKHGTLECLFTVDEETGLTGAFGLKPNILKSNILINLDSEDHGQIFIGCAGGKGTTVSINYYKENVPENSVAFKLTIKGLKGGHSGDDINKGLGNANKLMNRLLWNAADKHNLRLAKFDGGNLRNAIARESYAIVTILKSKKEQFINYVKEYNKIVKKELKTTEPNLEVSFKQTDIPEYLIDIKTQNDLLNALYACPHGVIEMSRDIPNFVETSTNLASIRTRDNDIFITTSQRSSVESALDDAVNMVSSTFKLIEAKIEHSSGYPGWTPNPDSEIVEITKNAFKKLFNKKPLVLAVHAGLECGLIGKKYPKMDMISYGPTIKAVHSPDEKININTVEQFWKLTIEVLKNIPEQK